MQSCDLYKFSYKVKEIFGLLQDDLSKDTFITRLKCDINPSLCNIVELMCLRSGISDAKKKQIVNWKDTVKNLNEKRKKIVIYGTGIRGQLIVNLFKEANLDFFAFTCRDWKNFPNGFMNKAVLNPEYLYDIKYQKDLYVIIGATIETGYFEEIITELNIHSFPENHILSFFQPIITDKHVKYFEFPDLFRRGTALVDCGCYSGKDSIFFAKWCHNNYSKIFAIEPNPTNAENIGINFKKNGLNRCNVIQAAVTDYTGEIEFEFNSSPSGGGILKEANLLNTSKTKYQKEEIQYVKALTIDDIVGKEEVGLIKMDIEGAEYSAIYGAKNTIQRDKPMLAICVYHKVGDILALIDLCRSLVPEYRFYIRQYDDAPAETVMYAVIKK